MHQTILALWLASILIALLTTAAAVVRVVKTFRDVYHHTRDSVARRVARQNIRRKLVRLLTCAILATLYVLSITKFAADLRDPQVEFRNAAVAIVALLLAVDASLDLYDYARNDRDVRRHEWEAVRHSLKEH